MLLASKTFISSLDKSESINNIVKYFQRKYSLVHFFTSSKTFSEFDLGNTILFQIKVFDEKIKGATLAMYLIKRTVRSSFMRLRIIMQINRIH